MVKKYDTKLKANVLQWNQLKDKGKLANVSKRLYDNNITAKQVLEVDKNGKYVMDSKTLKSSIGIKEKGKSFKNTEAFRRNVKQAIGTLDRKKGVKAEITPKFVKFTGNQFTTRTNRLLTDFNKTVGLNTFFDISNEVQKQYSTKSKKMSKKASYKKTRAIIDQYWLSKNKLSQKDIAILSLFS